MLPTNNQAPNLPVLYFRNDAVYEKSFTSWNFRLCCQWPYFCCFNESYQVLCANSLIIIQLFFYNEAHPTIKNVLQLRSSILKTKQSNKRCIFSIACQFRGTDKAQDNDWWNQVHFKCTSPDSIMRAVIYISEKSNQ